MEIDILHRQGFSNRQIAKELGISRNTVKKYLNRSKDDPQYERTRKKQPKLMPYQDYLKKRVEAALPNWLPAVNGGLKADQNGRS